MRCSITLFLMLITFLSTGQLPTMKNLHKETMYELEYGVVYDGKREVPKSEYDQVYRLKVGGFSSPIENLQDAGIPLLAFPNLMELDLSYNHFYHFPKGLGELTTLKKLNLVRMCAHDACESSLYSNFEFPENFYNLHSLRELKISFLDQSERNKLRKKLPAVKLKVVN